jgi:hypothetical protein
MRATWPAESASSGAKRYEYHHRAESILIGAASTDPDTSNATTKLRLTRACIGPFFGGISRSCSTLRIFGSDRRTRSRARSGGDDGGQPFPVGQGKMTIRGFTASKGTRRRRHTNCSARQSHADEDFQPTPIRSNGRWLVVRC